MPLLLLLAHCFHVAQMTQRFRLPSAHTNSSDESIVDWEQPDEQRLWAESSHCRGAQFCVYSIVVICPWWSSNLSLCLSDMPNLSLCLVIGLCLRLCLRVTAFLPAYLLSASLRPCLVV